MLKAKRILVSARLLNSREREKKKARLMWSMRVKQAVETFWLEESCFARCRESPQKGFHRKSLGPGHDTRLPAELQVQV